MSLWFRHYAGMMRDEKLVAAAVRAKQPVERVVWVWGALLESASEIEDAGRYDFDAAEAAYFLRCEESDIASTLSALERLGRIANGTVIRWADRQFESDKSKERQKRYRDRLKMSSEPSGDVTSSSPERHVTPQEPEAEQEPEDKPLAQQPIAAAPREKIPEQQVARPDASTLQRLLFEAAGISGFREERHPRLLDLSPIYGLIDANYDLYREILPVIRDRARNKTFSSWRFFEQAVIDTAASNRAIPPKPAASNFDWSAALDVYRSGTPWPHGWGPEPGTPGCRVPADLMINFQRERAA